METKKEKTTKKAGGISAGIVIACCFVIALCVFLFVFGNPDNFSDAPKCEKPVSQEVSAIRNYFGTIRLGGPVVPIVLTLLLTVLTLSVERFFALNKAKGTGNLIKFVAGIKQKLEANDIEGAQQLCSKQKGTVANVVNAGLRKYAEVEKLTDETTKEQKILAIQKEIEEATALELPTMEQNLPIVASISTLGTLFGLLGTVLGMIRSFSAMGTEGAPDSVKLAIGISEALINTAFGIATGALAIISYAYFTGKIDNITYAIDETGFSIVQTYGEKHTN